MDRGLTTSTSKHARPAFAGWPSPCPGVREAQGSLRALEVSDARDEGDADIEIPVDVVVEPEPANPNEATKQALRKVKDKPDVAEYEEGGGCLPSSMTSTQSLPARFGRRRFPWQTRSRSCKRGSSRGRPGIKNTRPLLVL